MANYNVWRPARNRWCDVLYPLSLPDNEHDKQIVHGLTYQRARQVVEYNLDPAKSGKFGDDWEVRERMDDLSCGSSAVGYNVVIARRAAINGMRWTICRLNSQGGRDNDQDDKNPDILSYADAERLFHYVGIGGLGCKGTAIMEIASDLQPAPLRNTMATTNVVLPPPIEQQIVSVNYVPVEPAFDWDVYNGSKPDPNKDYRRLMDRVKTDPYTGLPIKE